MQEITPDLLRRSTFDLDIPNFDKWNPGGERLRKWIKLDVNIFDDPKIVSLTPEEFQLYVRSLALRGQLGRSFRAVTTQWCDSRLAVARRSAVSQVVKLLKLGLFEIQNLKDNPLRIDKKRIEENRIDSSGVKNSEPSTVASVRDEASKKEPPTGVQAPGGEKPKPNTEANRVAWNAYREAYLDRHKVEPVRNQTVNSAIANFVKRLGEKEAPEVLRFYIKHNDGFYLKAHHPITLALRDAESLRTQWATNRTVTQSDIRNLERGDQLKAQLQRIESGEA